MSDYELHSSGSFTQDDGDGPQYLSRFINEVSIMPQREKIGEIGIEPNALGIPPEGATYEKMRSIFGEIPFDYWTNANFPKQWLEFSNIQPPNLIIEHLPELTLFFMFYCQTKDSLQMLSAKELQNRGWKYSDYTWTYDNKSEHKVFNINNWSIEEK
ncbi:hypothetical protein TVAG_478770 [Trichomonas vaginalis G3]|uniref:NOT2/NOT3/NOT5 C-terminal domain-containing protein n=1 Tax=Trichomonas vaginalis (strain ATCC PRA-98 / G3) TaxID=412133 RepID=A2DZZ3_TRIV3|nr:nuclear-transcribed mRNA catabolic process, deadenylation-dependent decay [Trichomonas vaginalis G3]EAY14052.1 hypothetical protein TVAG_478770 [Trichomonas vaginalis G3]KAI5519506.1 nuclear-transcribed mRNA catabolic process, deadenylation-dependent decay [Trichomonas vaginalis G3]|eukprot:XP_001326275.1 hypothetical protein [Trichomonas vaginalis G3]